MASQRLPGKPLLEIGGTTLIEHVYRRACSDARAVRRDRHRRRAASRARPRLRCDGRHDLSRRTPAAATALPSAWTCSGWGDDTLVVNLQGDEPLMPPACLDQAAALLAGDDRAEVASLYWPIADAEEADGSQRGQGRDRRGRRGAVFQPFGHPAPARRCRHRRGAAGRLALEASHRLVCLPGVGSAGVHGDAAHAAGACRETGTVAVPGVRAANRDGPGRRVHSGGRRHAATTSSASGRCSATRPEPAAW